MAIEDYRLHAVTGQYVGARQTCRTRADNGDGFAGLFHAAKVRTPAHFECFIVDIALNVTDGYRAELIVQGAGTFAQAVLRANPSADFR